MNRNKDWSIGRFTSRQCKLFCGIAVWSFLAMPAATMAGDAVDCVVGPWSDWPACSAECDGGVRCRTRGIVQPPMNGGLPCPALEECELCNEQPCDDGCGQICGDLDLDGDVDADDFSMFLATFARSSGHPMFNACADYDMDDVITFVDYQNWLQCYRDFVGVPEAPAPIEDVLLGDFDGDQDVDLADYGFFEICMTGPPAGLEFPCIVKFDYDSNQTLDLTDYDGFRASVTGPQ